MRILYLHRDPSFARFIKDDLEILAERHSVDDLRLEKSPRSMARLVRGLAGADLVYAWWGDLSSLAGALPARLGRKRVVMVTGGYDVADVPEIGYGLKHHPWKSGLPARVLGLADRLIVNSENGLRELRLAAPRISPARISVIPHGVDGAFFTPRDVPKERRVLTVSLLSRPYIPYKGLETFVRAAAAFPDVAFVHAGKDSGDGARDFLSALAPANFLFAGFLDDAALRREMQRATVYAQLSAHEGFGIALAEAMLCGATPVVTGRGAIPEVAGEVGEYAAYGDVRDTEHAIRRALDAPRPERARARILDNFPLERRRRALHALIDELAAAR